MASFAVCKQFRPRLDTTELLIYTRGESTMGAKRLMGAKRPGGKRLGGETTRGGNGLGRNVPNSPPPPLDLRMALMHKIVQVHILDGLINLHLHVSPTSERGFFLIFVLSA